MLVINVLWCRSNSLPASWIYNLLRYWLIHDFRKAMCDAKGALHLCRVVVASQRDALGSSESTESIKSVSAAWSSWHSTPKITKVKVNLSSCIANKELDMGDKKRHKAIRSVQEKSCGFIQNV